MDRLPAVFETKEEDSWGWSMATIGSGPGKRIIHTSPEEKEAIAPREQHAKKCSS